MGEFVASCHPRYSMNCSGMDTGGTGKVTDSKVVSNENLAVAIDTIFLTHFLRQPRSEGRRLTELVGDMEALGISPLETPPLEGAMHLQLFGKVKLGILSVEERVSIKEMSEKQIEKLAQCDAVLLLSALE